VTRPTSLNEQTKKKITSGCVGGDKDAGKKGKKKNSVRNPMGSRLVGSSGHTRRKIAESAKLDYPKGKKGKKRRKEKKKKKGNQYCHRGGGGKPEGTKKREKKKRETKRRGKKREKQEEQHAKIATTGMVSTGLLMRGYIPET